MSHHPIAPSRLQLTARDHVHGPATADVTLVEYGDYECPHCAHAHEVVEELCQVLGDRMRFAFRHFPLTQVHAHAECAAEAAEAADGQGRFWQMHETLFENQQELENPHLVEYASWIGLDIAPFIRELATHEFHDRVREDYLSGARSGVNGTPTFFIDGMRDDGPPELHAMLAALHEALGGHG